MKLPTRQYSMQVASDACTYLYLPAKQYRDKFFNQGNVRKHQVCGKLEVQEKFIEDLQAKKSAFQVSQLKPPPVHRIANVELVEHRNRSSKLHPNNEIPQRRQSPSPYKQHGDEG